MGNIERSDALPLRPNLAFASASLEQSFGLHYHASYYRYAQASLALGIVLIAADFLVDYLAFNSEGANISITTLFADLGSGYCLFLLTLCQATLADRDASLVVALNSVASRKQSSMVVTQKTARPRSRLTTR